MTRSLCYFSWIAAALRSILTGPTRPSPPQQMSRTPAVCPPSRAAAKGPSASASTRPRWRSTLTAASEPSLKKSRKMSGSSEELELGLDFCRLEDLDYMVLNGFDSLCLAPRNDLRVLSGQHYQEGIWDGLRGIILILAYVWHKIKWLPFSAHIQSLNLV